MKTIIRFVFTLLLFLPLCLSAQQKGVVKGRVFDSKNNEPIPFANVVIWKTSIGTAADENGYFRIENVPLGFNRLEVSSIGYTTKLSEEFMVNTACFFTTYRDRRDREKPGWESRYIESITIHAGSPFLSRFQK